jgi:hypothetical protein
MNNAAVRDAVTRLVSAVFFAAQTGSFTQVRSAAQERSQVAQFLRSRGPRCRCASILLPRQ